MSSGITTLTPTTETVFATSNLTDEYPNYEEVKLAHGIWVTVLYFIIFPPLAVLTIVGNLLVIVAFVNTRSLRKVSNYFLISLAVTDLLTGVISIPAHLVGRLLYSPVTCWSSTRFLFFVPTVILSCSSVYHLLAIAIDRMISVFKPLTHRNIVTAFRVKVVIAVIWIYNTGFGLLPIFIPDGSEPEWTCRAQAYGAELNVLTLIVAGFIPSYLILMSVLYMVMLRRISSQIRIHNELTNEQQDCKRGLVTMAIVVGVFGLCFSPSCFQMTYEVYGTYTLTQLIIIQTVCEYPLFINSMMNPIIYSSRNKDFNKAMWTIVNNVTGCFDEVNSKEGYQLSSQAIRNCESTKLSTCSRSSIQICSRP